jgi:hypothetical protein
MDPVEEMYYKYLDFGLDIIDGVGRFHLEGDRLPRESLCI